MLVQQLRSCNSAVMLVTSQFVDEACLRTASPMLLGHSGLDKL